MNLLSITILAAVPLLGNASLRGSNDTIEAHILTDWTQFKCMFAGKTDKNMCSEAVNPHGEACSFCTLKDTDSGSVSGLCVDPEVGPTMEKMNPQITCSSKGQSKTSSFTNGSAGYDELKCSTQGFTDSDKCRFMKTHDGRDHCQYCTMDDNDSGGLCASPNDAKAMRRLSPDVKCFVGMDVKGLPELKYSLVDDCYLAGKTSNTCLDPSKTNGKECAWCGDRCFRKSDRIMKRFQCQARSTNTSTLRYTQTQIL